MWTYDLAREQSPSLDVLRNLCRLSLEGGYNAFGLYMEHRFAYPSAPWAAGKGAVTPDMVVTLIGEFPELQIIPFVNLLGHFEGFMYTEGGQEFSEESFVGLQACPSCSGFLQLAQSLLEDVLRIFKSDVIHIGGDETAQLGKCPICAQKVRKWEAEGEGIDGKARLYGEHFGPLAQRVMEAGRRPAIWGDMLLEHSTAGSFLPKETLVFDWQYFGGATETSTTLMKQGFEVVLCPTLHTYNAPWFHVLESEQNIRIHAREARDMEAHGVCITTWEMGLFGSYDTLFPAIREAGKLISQSIESTSAAEADDLLPLQFAEEDSRFLKAYEETSPEMRAWAESIGVALQRFGPLFAFSKTRSALKARFLLYSNPFLLWLRNGKDLIDNEPQAILDLLNLALLRAPDEATKGITLFIRAAVEFILIAESSSVEYAEGRPEGAIAKLALSRGLFEDLEKVATRTHNRTGGSLADVERCRTAKEHVERVIVRMRKYGDGSLGYMPSFQMLTHPKFVPHDQAGWWLINKWANE